MRKVRTAASIGSFCAKARNRGTARTPESILELSYSHSRTTPNQVYSEILAFARIVASLKPKTLVEIGTNRGGTFFILCQLASPDAHVVSLDLPGARFSSGSMSLFERLLIRRMPQLGQKASFIRADSHDPRTVGKLRDVVRGQMVDLLFIDGDHTYEGVRKDFEMYSPLVRRGGVIALHDIAKHSVEAGCEVDRFWNEIRLRYRAMEIVEDKNQGWAGIGVIYN
jgi:cephalosporin hydroxylase